MNRHRQRLRRGAGPLAAGRPAGPAAWRCVCVLALGLAVAGCGASHTSRGPLRVVSLALTPSVDFPGPPSRRLTLTHGAAFTRIASLVPLPLPHEIEVNPRGTRHPLTVCFPMDLTIGLSDGSSAVYTSCYRPRSLRPVVAALCPLVGIRGFCARYHRELAGGSAAPQRHHGRATRRR